MALSAFQALLYTPFDPAEAESIATTLAFLREHHRCWQRDNYVGHLTASAWVVNAEQSHVLLTHHRKFNGWLQLGGHVVVPYPFRNGYSFRAHH